MPAQSIKDKIFDLLTYPENRGKPRNKKFIWRKEMAFWVVVLVFSFVGFVVSGSNFVRHLVEFIATGKVTP